MQWSIVNYCTVQHSTVQYSLREPAVKVSHLGLAQHAQLVVLPSGDVASLLYTYMCICVLYIYIYIYIYIDRERERERDKTSARRPAERMLMLTLESDA